MKYDEFQKMVGREYERWRKIDSSYRYGQCMFNMLAAFKGYIAEEIRATQLDPFYKDDVPAETWQYVYERW